MKALRHHTGRAVSLPRESIDTDQIVPARFCKRITRTGFEDALFADWRQDPGFALNDPRRAGASFLVSGANFGIGSSREHAVWALRDYGFQAVISSAFGEIFRGNALKNGLLPIVLSPAEVTELVTMVDRDAELELTIDLAGQRLSGGGRHWAFDIEPRAKQMILNGDDEIAASLQRCPDLSAYEARRPRWLPRIRPGRPGPGPRGTAGGSVAGPADRAAPEHPGRRSGQPRTISIFDTTLRDGEQAPGNAMSPDDKLAMALQLESLGVDVIEVGFPASSSSDYRAAELAAQALSHATIATFARSREPDIATAVEAVGTERHQVQLLVTSSDLHLTYKRGISRSACVREASSAVRFAASLGLTDISVGLEDASRSDPELLRALVEASVEAGATTIVVADTSGCLLPAEFGALIGRTRSWLPSGVTLATHCHNDLGLALPNALAGLAAGAHQVQTTLGGVGERSGNTALEELAAVLLYKQDQLGVTTALRTEKLYEAYLGLRSAMRLEPARQKAIVGDNSFTTSAGIHQDGMLQRPETYEYIEPTRFGRERQLLVGRHSGRAVLRYLLDRQDLRLGDEAIGWLYEELIRGREDSGTETLGEFSDRVLERVAELPAGQASRIHESESTPGLPASAI